MWAQLKLNGTVELGHDLEEVYCSGDIVVVVYCNMQTRGW